MTKEEAINVIEQLMGIQIGHFTDAEMLTALDMALDALTHDGWHPASEVPPIGECGISDAMICIAKDYDVCRSRYYKDSGWDYNVKWWCYPPKIN